MRGVHRAGAALTLAAGVLLDVPACATGPDRTASEPARDGVVTVASFNFGESELVAEIYAQALEAAGVPVGRRMGLGPRELVEPALEQGWVDVVPEYVGTALSFAEPGSAAPSNTTSRALDRLDEALGRRGLEVLEPAPAESQNALVVTRADALAFSLRTVSDLVPLAGAFTIGGPPECPERPFCLPGLEEVYGLEFERFVPLDSGGPLSLAALQTEVVDVAVLFSTDANLDPDELVVLEDDRGLQPAENLVPVVRPEVLDRYGDRLSGPLDRVSAALTTDVVVSLNRRVAGGASPAAVAREWLASL